MHIVRTTLTALISAGLISGCALIQRALPSALSDEKVVSLFDTIDANQVKGAQLARRQASSSAVRDYAERLAFEHAALLTRKRVLIDRIHMQPEGSSLTSSIEAASSDRLEALEKKSGLDFDRAYIDYQIAMHNAALDIVDETAINDAELKDNLRDARLNLIAHAAKARSVRQQLRAASAGLSSER
jgi:putative membrane protein